MCRSTKIIGPNITVFQSIITVTPANGRSRYLNERKEPEENPRILAQNIRHHGLQSGADPARYQLLVTAFANPGQAAAPQQQLLLCSDSC